MFTRLKTVRARGRTYHYVQLVENHRENGQVRQRLIASLGRLDQLLDQGDLEQVVKGLVRYLPQLRLIEAQRQQSLVAETDRI